MAFVQAVHAANDAAGTTLGVAITATSGNLLAVGAFGLASTPGATASDGTNTYTQVDSIQRGASFTWQQSLYAKNITGGSLTTTFTASSSTFRRIQVAEYSGLDTTAPLEDHAAQIQNAPGSGTDAATSGNGAGTTTDGDTIVSFLWNDNSATLPTAGTSFTGRDLFTNSGDANGVEDRVQATHGATDSGTWTTNDVSASTLTTMMAFKPSGASAPSVTLQPANTTVSDGSTAQFSVAATFFGTSPTYQWQDNRTGSFTNVSGGSGATTATYTTATVTQHFSSRQYLCVVSDSAGSTNSNSASLTVSNISVILWDTSVQSGNDVWLRDPTLTAASGGYTVSIDEAMSLSDTSNASVGGSGTPNTYSTTFPSDENPISEGGFWINGLDVGLDWNNLKTLSGNAVGSVAMTVARYADDIGHVSTAYGTASNDQWAQGTVYKAGGYTGNGGTHEVELLLRFSISANDAHGYEVLWGMSASTSYMAVVRWNGTVGSYTAVYDPGAGSAPTPNDGDILYAQIVGNIITVKINGSVVSGFGSVDVSAIGGTVYSSGQPGMGFWPVDGAIAANMGWKDWSAGSFTINVNEAMTLSSAQDALVNFVVSISESITLASTQDGVAAGSGFAANISEAMTLASTQSNVAAFGASISEGMTLTESVSNQASLSAAATESLTLADSANRQTGFATAISESLPLADSAFNAATLSASQTESMNLADTSNASGAGAYNASQTEAISLADNASVVAALSASITEGITLAHTQTNIAALSAAISEGILLSDSSANVAAFGTSISESMALADSENAASGGGSFSAGIIEALNLIESINQQAALTAGLTEAMVLDDVSSMVNSGTALDRQYPLEGLVQDTPLMGQSLQYPLEGLTQTRPLS